MTKVYQLTKEGRAELKHELDDLVSQRPTVAEEIKVARESGDLSENAEYQLAREQQNKNEMRISEIEEILASSELIEKTNNRAKIELGSHVKLHGKDSEREYQIVGTVEADPLEGKISDESPIGQALLGKAVGDTVELGTVSEKFSYKITSIS